MIKNLSKRTIWFSRVLSGSNDWHKIIFFLEWKQLSLEWIKENNLDQYQAGFMKEKAMMDQIFSVRTMMERAAEYNIQTHHFFVDFNAAYESMIQEELFDGMIILGI